MHSEHCVHFVFKLVWSDIFRETMHALTVEEEPQEGMTPGEVNDREYMARVRFAWSKCNRMMCLLQLQDLVIHCLVGNPSRNAVKDHA